MQLGTRWPVGATPPDRLPAAMVAAIAEVEAEVTELDTSSWRWTLTWLEGRPIAELDDGTTLRYDPLRDSVSRDPEVDSAEGPVWGLAEQRVRPCCRDRLVCLALDRDVPLELVAVQRASGATAPRLHGTARAHGEPRESADPRLARQVEIECGGHCYRAFRGELPSRVRHHKLDGRAHVSG